MEMNFDAITKLYEQMEIHQKPGGGGRTFPYVKSSDVFDKMNKTFSGNWSTRVFYQEIRDKDHIVGVEVSVASDPSNSTALGVVSQVGFGSALRRYDSDETGNLFKSALSKAIKDACKKWGVALSLEESTTNISDSAPVTPPSFPNSPAPTTVPNTMPGMPSTLPSQPPVTPNHQSPSSDYTPTPPNPVNGPPMPSNNPPAGLPKVPFAEERFEPPVSSSSVPTNPSPPTGGGMPQMPTMPIPNTEAEGFISDVQKVALNTVIQYKMPPGMDYNGLVVASLNHRGLPVPEVIPDKDSLTYQQAVAVIKFGNDEKIKKS